MLIPVGHQHIACHGVDGDPKRSITNRHTSLDRTGLGINHDQRLGLGCCDVKCSPVRRNGDAGRLARHLDFGEYTHGGTSTRHSDHRYGLAILVGRVC